MKVSFLTKIALITILFSINHSFSQQASELPKVIPPSPTVANLMQFEEVPVSHYTGQPNISIPLFSKALHNDIGLNIALSYNTQGIKIDNRSGWVGTGWSLEAGGVISRTVRGLPDEKRKVHGNPLNGTGVFHNDNFWRYDDPGYMFDRQEFTWNTNGSPDDLYDYQLDLFQFNVLGLSGRFVIIKDVNNNALIPKLLTKDQNIKIEIDYDQSTFELNGFTIVDTKGIRYLFDDKEILTTSTLTDSELQNGEFTGFTGQEVTNVSSWYLSQIETSNSSTLNPKILADFQYTDSHELYVLSKSRTWNTYKRANTQIVWNSMRSNNYNASVLPPKYSVTTSTSNGNTRKLSKITFRDQSSIEFLSGGSHPETNGMRLGDIVLKNSLGTENKRFKFNYELTDRLWLTSIEEKASLKTNTYTFEYIDKENLPPFDSLQDEWGYNASGQPVVSSATCTRTPFDKEAIKKGLLHKIIYPTGGVKEFEFEHHTISYQSQISNILPPQEPRAVKISDDKFRELNPDNWIFDTFSMDYPSGPAVLGYQLPGSFSITQEQDIVFKRSFVNIQLINGNQSTVQEVLDNSLIKLYDSSGVESATFNLGEEETIANLDPGTYVAKLYLFDLDVIYTIETCLSYIKHKSEINRYVYGGGVRIKDIIFRDDNLPGTPESRKISYGYTDAEDLSSSSGAIDGNIEGIFKNYELDYSRYLFEFDDQGCHPFNFKTFTLTFETYSRTLNAETTKGQYVGYKTVKEIEDGKGQTRYYFTSAQDFASPENVFNYPYSPAPNIDYKRGLLLKQQVFKQNYTPYPPGEEPPGLLKEVINNYEYLDDEGITSYRLYSNEDCVWKVVYSSYYQYINAIPNGALDQCFGIDGSCNSSCAIGYSNCSTLPYYLIHDNVEIGWAQLTETRTIDYYYDDQGNQSSSESRQEFTYDPLNFQIKEQNTYFTEDGEDQHLKSIFYYPTSNGVYPTAGLLLINKLNEVLAVENYKNGQRTETIINTYKDFAPNLTLPEKVQFAKAPIPPGDGSQYDLLVNLEDRIIYHTYDDYSNPLEVSKADGTHIVYIWGYGKTLPIAKIENATLGRVKDELALIGSSVDALQTLSDEDTDNCTEVSCKEQELRDGLNILRTILPNAMVTTFTHDPLAGITSVTDPRGNVVYYRYDEFNRLEYVKDKDEKVLSINKYNYKN